MCTYWKKLSLKKLSTKNNKRIDSIGIGLASPEEIRRWGERRLPNGTLVGKVDRDHTVDYESLKPIEGGLFCERIFGPVEDFYCSCERRGEKNEKFCPDCEVEFTKSRVRRTRMGFIPLAVPVAHVWYLRGRPSYIANLIGKSRNTVDKLAYGETLCESFIGNTSTNYLKHGLDYLVKSENCRILNFDSSNSNVIKAVSTNFNPKEIEEKKIKLSFNRRLSHYQNYVEWRSYFVKLLHCKVLFRSCEATAGFSIKNRPYDIRSSTSFVTCSPSTCTPTCTPYTPTKLVLTLVLSIHQNLPILIKQQKLIIKDGEQKVVDDQNCRVYKGILAFRSPLSTLKLQSNSSNINPHMEKVGVISPFFQDFASTFFYSPTPVTLSVTSPSTNIVDEQVTNIPTCTPTCTPTELVLSLVLSIHQNLPILIKQVSTVDEHTNGNFYCWCTVGVDDFKLLTKSIELPTHFINDPKLVIKIEDFDDPTQVTKEAPLFKSTQLSNDFSNIIDQISDKKNVESRENTASFVTSASLIGSRTRPFSNAAAEDFDNQAHDKIDTVDANFGINYIDSIHQKKAANSTSTPTPLVFGLRQINSDNKYPYKVDLASTSTELVCVSDRLNNVRSSGFYTDSLSENSRNSLHTVNSEDVSIDGVRVDGKYNKFHTLPIFSTFIYKEWSHRFSFLEYFIWSARKNDLELSFYTPRGVCHGARISSINLVRNQIGLGKKPKQFLFGFNGCTKKNSQNQRFQKFVPLEQNSKKVKEQHIKTVSQTQDSTTFLLPFQASLIRPVGDNLKVPHKHYNVSNLRLNWLDPHSDTSYMFELRDKRFSLVLCVEPKKLMERYTTANLEQISIGSTFQHKSSSVFRQIEKFFGWGYSLSSENVSLKNVISDPKLVTKIKDCDYQMSKPVPKSVFSSTDFITGSPTTKSAFCSPTFITNEVGEQVTNIPTVHQLYTNTVGVQLVSTVDEHTNDNTNSTPTELVLSCCTVGVDDFQLLMKSCTPTKLVLTLQKVVINRVIGEQKNKNLTPKISLTSGNFRQLEPNNKKQIQNTRIPKGSLMWGKVDDTQQFPRLAELLQFTGGTALRHLLSRFHLVLLSKFIRHELKNLELKVNFLLALKMLTYSQGLLLGKLAKRRSKQIRRLKLLELFQSKKSNPEWMILSVLPVLPPDLRPILRVNDDFVVASDLNRLYQTVLRRNNTIHERLDDPLPCPESGLFRQRSLQKAVDGLLENGKGGGTPLCASKRRPLVSLSHVLKGKKGLFRQHLLGKRVDYSGRSVIVVGPKLNLHECGLPKEMALELFQPFLIHRLKVKGLATSNTTARRMIQQENPLIWHTVKQLVYEHPVLLNRAPTLHRLGIQAFQPRLVSGRAILLHPLVCNGFNADFDGDQMAVHVPLSFQARAEAWKIMWSKNNLLSPATGQPILVPSQDMVLGCYYLSVIIPRALRSSESNKKARLFVNKNDEICLKPPTDKSGVCDAVFDSYATYVNVETPTNWRKDTNEDTFRNREKANKKLSSSFFEKTNFSPIASVLGNSQNQFEWGSQLFDQFSTVKLPLNSSRSISLLGYFKKTQHLGYLTDANLLQRMARMEMAPNTLDENSGIHNSFLSWKLPELLGDYFFNNLCHWQNQFQDVANMENPKKHSKSVKKLNNTSKKSSQISSSAYHLKMGHYFSNLQDSLMAYSQGRLETHKPFWVRLDLSVEEREKEAAILRENHLSTFFQRRDFKKRILQTDEIEIHSLVSPHTFLLQPQYGRSQELSRVLFQENPHRFVIEGNDALEAPLELRLGVDGNLVKILTTFQNHYNCNATLLDQCKDKSIKYMRTTAGRAVINNKVIDVICSSIQ